MVPAFGRFINILMLLVFLTSYCFSDNAWRKGLNQAFRDRNLRGGPAHAAVLRLCLGP